MMKITMSAVMKTMMMIKGHVFIIVIFLCTVLGCIMCVLLVVYIKSACCKSRKLLVVDFFLISITSHHQKTILFCTAPLFSHTYLTVPLSRLPLKPLATLCLEKVQCFALKLHSKNWFFNYSSLLGSSNLPSLSTHCNRSIN